MPELPEVETLVRQLAKELPGARIKSVDVKWKRSIATPSVPNFKRKLEGSRFLSVTRRAKFLVFELQSSTSQKPLNLFCHLRMSGHLAVFSSKAAAGKFDRVVFNLKDRRELRFRDMRKFGRFYLVEKQDDIIGDLGPEPLDASFRSSDFIDLVKQRRGAIKPLLLNQRFLAGLGNIYVDESLWRAGIHPLSKANTIGRAKLQALYRAIRLTLRKAISDQGTDSGDNVVEEGQHSPQVYGRQGEACRRCGKSIRKIVVGQRGTHYCPKCQRNTF